MYIGWVNSYCWGLYWEVFGVLKVSFESCYAQQETLMTECAMGSTDM